MATKYKDYMIRWAFKATWTFLEAALILNEINPEGSTFVPDKQGNDRVSVLYFWLVKERRNGNLPAEDEGQCFRTSPGDIIRHIRAHNQRHSKDVAELWEVARYEKNIGGKLADISWTVYELAKDILVTKYTSITKEQVAHALSDLPKYYSFPNGMPLMPYAYGTLLRKFRKAIPNVKPGRPENARRAEIDLAQIAKEIRL